MYVIVFISNLYTATIQLLLSNHIILIKSLINSLYPDNMFKNYPIPIKYVPPNKLEKKFVYLITFSSNVSTMQLMDIISYN